MNRDYPLAPTLFQVGSESKENKKVARLEKKEDRLVYRGNKAVDEGRDRKADRLLGRAAKVENRVIKAKERMYKNKK